ncbi:RHS repeat protein [Lysobacter capsici]|nr:RHS repeat protein [Lysobacter capsici]
MLDPVGGEYLYAYDAQNRLETVTYPGGTQRRYHYNESAYTAGNNLPNALTGITREDGQRYAIFTYGSDGKAKSTEHAGGVEKFSSVYDASGSATVTTPNGSVQVRSFTTALGVKKASSVQEQCSGCATRTTSYTYDANGYLDLKTDPRGVRTDYDYNARGLLQQKVDAANDTTGSKRTTQTDWDAVFAVPAERRVYDASGILLKKTAWRYNARGQQIAVDQVDPSSGAVRTSETTYCEQSDVDAGACPFVGLIRSQNGPRTDVADVTRYDYYTVDAPGCATSSAACDYRKGDLRRITNALNQSNEVLRYDAAGRVHSLASVNGVVSDFEYNARGWVISSKVRGPDDSVETDDVIAKIEYEPTGLVKKVTQADGSFIRYGYDAGHRLTRVYDNAGNSIQLTLDNAGNRIKEDTLKDDGSLKRTLSRVYDQLGQLATSKTAYDHPTGFTYDANGNDEVTTDALGRKTDNDYDPLNRLARSLQDVGGINAKTEFKYDVVDRVTKVTDPKNLDTTYTYNGFGDQVQLTSPDTGVSTYTYDSAGNRKTETDARNITRTYGYDALNRPTAVAYPTTSLNVGYEYDFVPTVCATGETFAKGRLSLITDASGSTQYCYDRFGRMVRKVQTTNGKVFAVRYAYTLAGQLSGVTYPDGALVSYQRDVRGRVSQVDAKRAVAGAGFDTLLSQAAYHAFGPVASWTYGNGRTLARPVDLDYRTTAVTDPSLGGLSVGFGFDLAGNLNQLTPAGSSTSLLKYDYDGLDRLTHLRDGPSNTPIETYSYDATGNRLSLTQASGTQTYVYPATSHRLAQVGNSGLRGYDPSGNTTDIDANSFVYNDAGRMSQLKQSGVLKMTYLYNGLGEQVRKYTDADNRYMVYDESGHWLGEYDSNGATIQQAIWMYDLPVGVLAGGGAQQKLHYVEPDHLGTPRVVIDPVRNVAVWSWDLKGEAFGNSAPNQDPDLDGTAFVFDMRFPGQRFDSISGLSYNYFRDYEAGAGRYVQSDPIGLSGGINTYAYVRARPMDVIDPRGLNGVGVGVARGVLSWIALDTAVPEPTDLAWPKWVAYGAGAAIAGGLLWAANESGNEYDGTAGASEGSEKICKPAIADVQARDFCEQMALAEAKAGAGRVKMGTMGDEPRLVAHYGVGPWMKMEHTHVCPNGRRLTIHYFSNLRGSNVELKFVYGASGLAP